MHYVYFLAAMQIADYNRVTFSICYFPYAKYPKDLYIFYS